MALALNPYQIVHLVDHAPNGRRVLHLHRVADAPQPQATHRVSVRLQPANGGADLGHLDFLRHGRLPRNQLRISATLLPRFAATWSGEAIAFRALMVAWTTFTGLVEPEHVARTLCTPASSSTARMAPPAMIPVPSEAGCMYTLEAPWRALIG